MDRRLLRARRLQNSLYCGCSATFSELSDSSETVQNSWFCSFSGVLIFMTVLDRVIFFGCWHPAVSRFEAIWSFQNLKIVQIPLFLMVFDLLSWNCLTFITNKKSLWFWMIREILWRLERWNCRSGGWLNNHSENSSAYWLRRVQSDPRHHFRPQRIHSSHRAQHTVFVLSKIQTGGAANLPLRSKEPPCDPKMV